MTTISMVVVIKVESMSSGAIDQRGVGGGERLNAHNNRSGAAAEIMDGV